MKTLFIPKNDIEKDLVKTITTSKEKTKRVSALKKLRKLTGKDETTMVSQEVYQHIKGKPSYFKQFLKASISIYPTGTNIGYNYK